MVTNRPPELRSGNRLIVLAYRGKRDRAVNADPCGIVPQNPANLEIVRQAIAGNLPPAKH